MSSALYGWFLWNFSERFLQQLIVTSWVKQIEINYFTYVEKGEIHSLFWVFKRQFFRYHVLYTVRYSRKITLRNTGFKIFKASPCLETQSLFQVKQNFNEVAHGSVNSLSYWSHSLKYSCTAHVKLYFFDWAHYYYLYEVTIFIIIFSHCWFKILATLGLAVSWSTK